MEFFCHYSNKEVNDPVEKVAKEKEKLEIPIVTVKEVCSKNGESRLQFSIKLVLSLRACNTSEISKYD